MNQQTYRQLVSGGSRSLGACLLRTILWIVSIGYSLVVRLRNLLYSKGWLKVHRVDPPVICVGNLTVGGTGKTPLVVWLSKQMPPDTKYAILTRGYKSTQTSDLKTQNHIDEPGLLAQMCPGAKVIVNPDRVAGATQAIEKFDAKVLIMDDGFQHRRLARDLDIVAIDATQPFGYGKMLPAGLLREPAASLKRAGAVVITRCDQIGKTQLSGLEEELRTINPNMVIAKSIHAAVSARKTDNEQVGIGQLKDKKIFAFCGIGNPDAFLNTVKALGSELVGSRVYDDHHHYTDACLADIREQAKESGADLVLTTQKDWTKVISDSQFPISGSKSSVPFAYLAIEIRFVADEDKLTALIQDTLAGRISTED